MGIRKEMKLCKLEMERGWEAWLVLSYEKVLTLFSKWWVDIWEISKLYKENFALIKIVEPNDMGKVTSPGQRMIKI